MAKDFVIDAFQRDVKGKGASRRLRREERKMPAILYGGEGKEPVMLTLWHNDLKKAIENEAFFSHVLTLNIDGKKEKAIIKDLQRHPFKPLLTHADFMRVEKGHKITVQVPLHFLNETTNEAVKLQGGVISHQLNELEVSCLPDALPEYIEVDLQNLGMDETVHISDLTLPKGVESVALAQGEDHDLPVAAIHLPRGSKVDDEDADSEGEEGEGEGDKE